MTAEMTTVANYLITRLKQVGVEHVFTIPGDYAGPFLEALDAADGITRVPNILELGCGYAADGYARFKGAGAACVQYGVGGMSLLNCVAGSWVERVPVCIISASPKTSWRKMERQKHILFHHSTGDLEADQMIFENVTVASEILSDPTEAPRQIDRALADMLTYRRPIYLEGLTDVWTMSCPAPKGRLVAATLASEPDSLAAAVESAWHRIRAAKLPVIWAGVEIQRFGLQEKLQQLIDASGMNFTTTSLGKTVLDETQPRFIGTYADAASPALTRAVMLATDCVLALGAIITDDYLPIMTSTGPANKYAAMIEINDEEARVGQEYYQHVELSDFLDALLAKVKADPHYPATYALPAYTPDPQETMAPGDPMNYNRFYQGIERFLKANNRLDETILVLGESTSLYVFGNMFGMPANSFVSEAAWGSLGHETGCALGVALGSGKRPWVVAGDGGFRMVCQELSSLAYHKCDAVVFVMSNNAYAIEQAFVDITAFQPTGQFAPFDILPKWDYKALAKAFGAESHRAATVGELDVVLSKVAERKGVPTLVEIVIPEKDLAPQLKRLAGG